MDDCHHNGTQYNYEEENEFESGKVVDNLDCNESRNESDTASLFDKSQVAVCVFWIQFITRSSLLLFFVACFLNAQQIYF